MLSCYAPMVLYAAENVQPAATDKAAPCAALAQLSGNAIAEPTARIVTAKLNAPSEARVIPGAPEWMPPTTPAMPEHCEVVGTMRERTGSDGQRYAVRFRLRLPTKWNGRFLFEGGGGTNGMLGDAAGRAAGGRENALTRGFAVVSTDTGHDNATNSNPQRQGQVAFGHDYEARLEYAEKALDSVATTAKTIVKAYYGRPARFNYFAGCSNGGREGMEFSQRFPEHFDGIVAGAPAFAVPKAAIAEAWDTQTFSALATKMGLQQPNGLPDIARAFSNADLQLVADAVVASCDTSDGRDDGMVQLVTQCTTERVRPALDAKACKAEKAEGCLTKDQIAALIRSLSGPRDSSGKALYADWPWDVGIGSEGWRMWKLGAPGRMGAINIALGSAALSGLFVTPPEVVAGSPDASHRYQLGFDFDRDAPKIFATTPAFPRSGWDLVGARSSDLAAFRKRGGKMLVPHGASDPIFSINDTIAWWREVNESEKGRAAEFVRVFAVPGMAHCGQGPSTSQYDALSAIMAWVEEGKAPDRIEAVAGRDTPWPGRTRPLCPYPQYARYRSGDAERTESFVCEMR